MTLQNSALAEAVRDHFKRDSRLANQCIDVEVSDRDVMLVGCTSTEELRRTAEEVARGVPGARHVENKIVVRGGLTYNRPATIT